MFFLRMRRCPRFTTAGSRGFRRKCSTGGPLGTNASTGSSLGTNACTGGSLGTIVSTGGPLGTNASTGSSLGTNACTGASLGTIASTGASLGTNASTGGPLGTIASTGASLGTNAMGSLVPTSPLATMVPIIKILVIVLTNLVSAPFRMLSLKIIPVLRMSLIPRIPPRRIPVIGSYNIDLRICVIRGKSNSRAEKVLQDSIQKPITFVKGPGRIIPNIRCHGNILGRVLIVIALSGRRSRHRADRASSQQNYQ